MSSEEPLSNDVVSKPYVQIFHGLRQINDSITDDIANLQNIQKSIQTSLELLPPFIKGLESGMTEWGSEEGKAFLIKAQNTGHSIYSGFQSGMFGPGVFPITAGTSSIILNSNVSALVHDAPAVFDLSATRQALEKLTLPIQSSLRSMIDATVKVAPGTVSLAEGIEEALRQTTAERRYEHAAGKFREFLSELGQVLAPEPTSATELPWLERDDKGKLTQASRYRFALYDRFPPEAYYESLVRMGDELAKELREDYHVFSRFAHNRGVSIRSSEAEPAIHEAALRVVQLLDLAEKAEHRRYRLVQIEIDARAQKSAIDKKFKPSFDFVIPRRWSSPQEVTILPGLGYEGLKSGLTVLIQISEKGGVEIVPDSTKSLYTLDEGIESLPKLPRPLL